MLCCGASAVTIWGTGTPRREYRDFLGAQTARLNLNARLRLLMAPRHSAVPLRSAPVPAFEELSNQRMLAFSPDSFPSRSREAWRLDSQQGITPMGTVAGWNENRLFKMKSIFSPAQPVNRTDKVVSIGATQSLRAYRSIREAIVTCQLAPGARLHIGHLARDHEVSPGAVREALAMLEKEGFIVTEPQKGSVVSPVSSADLLDLTLARVEIEKACLASSLLHGDIEWESQLVASFHRTCRRGAGHEPVFSHGDADWIAAHDGFHTALVAACRSQRLLATRSLLYDQSERYRRLSVAFSVERDVETEHRHLLEAALDRDVSAAQSLLEAHVKATAEALIDASL